MANNRKKKTSIKKKVAWVATILVIVICVVFVAAVAILNYRPSAETDGENPITESIQTPEDAKEKVVNFLCVGVDESESLTDVIIYLSYDKQAKKASLFRIPRDSFVGEDVPSGKINAVYGHPAEGQTKIGALIEKINSMFCLPVDHYVTITLEGFRSVVDSIGGVDVTIPQTIYYDEGMIIPEGEQHLDGEKAEWFVRYRAGYANADLGRIDAQNIFIKAFMEKVKDLGRMQLISLLSDDYQYITTDMTVGEMIGYAGDLFHIDVEDMESVTAPGDSAMYGDISVYEIDAEEAADILNESFRPYSEPVSADELNIPSVYSGYDSYGYGDNYGFENNYNEYYE